jgi:hypothetical protein
MNDPVFTLVPVLITLVVAGLIAYLVWRTHKARVAAWAEFASRHQQHLYELSSLYADFHIKAGWIQAERRNVPSTADELEEFTGPALMLAHTLEEASQRSKGWTTG